MAENHGTDKTSFTGSTLTGRKIPTTAAEISLKDVSIKLGGNRLLSFSVTPIWTKPSSGLQ